jgi:hypothetical protein
MEPYDPVAATRVLDGVRDGKLLSTACRTEGIDRKDFYAWLRDKEARVDQRPLSEVFAEADEDRRMTWRETALQIVNALSVDSPPNEVTIARAKSSMFMQMAKESSLDIFSRTVAVSKDGETVVVLRRFMPLDPGEDLE